MSIVQRCSTHIALSSVQSECLVKLKSSIYWGKKNNKNSLSVSFPLRAPVCLSGQDTDRPCAAGLLAAVTLRCPWSHPLLACCWSLLLSPPALWFACMLQFGLFSVHAKMTLYRERSALSTKDGAARLSLSLKQSEGQVYLCVCMQFKGILKGKVSRSCSL